MDKPDKPVSNYSWIFVFRGCITVAFGAFVLFSPALTLFSLAFAFFLLAVVDGLLAIIIYLGRKAQWGLVAEGSAGMACAIFTLIGPMTIGSMLWPNVSTVSLLIFISARALINGLAEVITGLRYKGTVEKGWMLSLSDGLRAGRHCAASSILCRCTGAGLDNRGLRSDRRHSVGYFRAEGQGKSLSPLCPTPDCMGRRRNSMDDKTATAFGDAEKKRLTEAREGRAAWKKWGPISASGSGEPCVRTTAKAGMPGTSSPMTRPAPGHTAGARTASPAFPTTSSTSALPWRLWNGKDPILKERLFGLTNSEGNHGEDVKEYYFYLDSTPTHSYMKYLYKYPQAAYPYADLVETNRRRSRDEMEYELLDTGVFNDDRYFDVFVEYAKAGPEDILVRITAVNRGPDAAELHLLPTLWFRNDWAAWIAESNRSAEKPMLRQIEAAAGTSAVAATHPLLGEFILYCEGDVPLLFTENETNNERLFPGQKNESPYVKDGINNCVVQGRQEEVNPGKQGTKVAAHYQRECRRRSDAR